MADSNGAPRRVSMAYILGFSKNPYKYHKPPPELRPPPSSGLNQLMTTPGGIVEWAASDGRKGSLKGPGKTRSRADKSADEAEGKKGGAVDVPSANPHKFTEEEDRKLLDWKNTNGSAPWKQCGEALKRDHFQCKDRYKELQGKDGGQDASNEKDTGGGNNQQHGKGNNKQAKSGGDDAGDNPHGFTEAEDKKLMDWRSEHVKQNWDDFATEIKKLPKQCADRFREIKPKDWKPAGAQGNGGGGNKQNKNNKNKKNKDKGNENENEKKERATTAGTDPGGSDVFGGGMFPFGGEDDDKQAESGGTDNDNTGGDTGNNNAWDQIETGGTGGTSGNNENSWGGGAWGDNDKANDITSGNKGSDGWNNTAGADTGGGASGDWGATSNNGKDGWDNTAEVNKSGGGAEDWGATAGGNDTSGNNVTGGGDDAWASGNGGGNNGGGGDDAWNTAATGGDSGKDAGWGGEGSKHAASNVGGNNGWGGGGSNKAASNAGGGGWGDTGGDGANDAAAADWNADFNNQQSNDTSGGDQNAWGGGGDTWGAAPGPAKTASKAGSKPPSHHSASHKSSPRHSSQSSANAPVELEVRPDDVFSADDLRLVARILQQDYQMVWNRVSWRFKDKTGRTIAPEVFEKKITGRVEGMEGKDERRQRRRK